MIELKQAMSLAKEFIIDVTPEVRNLQPEEVLLTDDKKRIEVVYSFNKKISEPDSLQKALGLERPRRFKKVVLDRGSGEVLGMYNWSYEQRQAA